MVKVKKIAILLLVIVMTSLIFIAKQLFFVENGPKLKQTGSSSKKHTNSIAIKKTKTDISESSSTDAYELKANTAYLDAVDLALQEAAVNVNRTGTVRYVKDDDGLVIFELDNDPSSPTYEKPLVSYQHLNGRITSKTSYSYLEDGSVRRATLDIAYDDDGRVSDFRRRQH